MNADLVNKLCCPAPGCQAEELLLRAHCTETIQYSIGPIEEVKSGEIICGACGREYPIIEYVPQFDALFPPALKEEAEYWDRWYGFTWERGYLGFFDLRAPRAPLISEGIEALDPSSLMGLDLGGSHTELAEHPLVKGARDVLDIGCGTGWSSLDLARRGHNVVGFDPCVSNMRRAKRYAISQGEYIEYMAAALGYLTFKPDTFDALFALHSIHHVPDLRQAMSSARTWLREGGAIAVDEHIQNNPMLLTIQGAMQAWAQTEVYPQARTLSPEELRGLPAAEASILEDAGSHEVIEAMLENFVLESFSSRYVSLDFFSFNYYLSRDRDMRAYHYSADVLHRFFSLLLEAYPEGAEYVSMVARKGERPDMELSEVAAQAMRLAGDRTSMVEAYAGAPGVSMLKAERALLKRELAAAQAAIDHTQEDMAFMHTAINSLRADIERLNGIIATKNSHIEHLENVIHRQEGVLKAQAQTPHARHRHARASPYSRARDLLWRAARFRVRTSSRRS
ncbi:MAG TPA: methyltransferase domain-containing protein [Chloroflexia bacterium]|jgi:ubiquinone/menaquinone biosynthesis C-methylase UbiE/uncharacterized protein YbaR (Trm112 family)